MAEARRLWIVISASLITLISAGMFAWNASSSSIVDPDPPPVVHRNPPEGTETKSKRHPPETVIIENVTSEVRRGFVNLTN